MSSRHITIAMLQITYNNNWTDSQKKMYRNQVQMNKMTSGEAFSMTGRDS